MMNSRERFNAFVHGRSVDHVPDFEFWFWDGTLLRWVDEGLPEDLTPTATPNGGELRRKLCEFFGFEMIDGIPIKTRFVRTPREEVIAEDEDTETVRTEIGEELVRFKPGKGESIPTHIEYAVKTREDWERVRDAFLPLDIEPRLPKNWDGIKDTFNGWTTILNTPQMGFYGFLRNLMGVEEISVTFALDPDWIAEMMDHLLAIYLAVSRTIVDAGIQPDITGWWEDMCYNTGPLISPAMFEQFMVPRYKRVTDFWRSHGVDRAILDSDGNLHKLAPLWHRAGINILIPCEAAHTDVLQLRRENPADDFYMRGGVNKRELAKGRAAIDAELERIARVMDLGNFMPHVDHLVPPDVSYADYMYYREKKQKLLGK
ncbi:MAG: hypothetical protein ACOC7R_00065 [Planctomycetota bacterium]